MFEAPVPQAFVSGTGRCGSTLLSNLFRLNPFYLSLSEWFTALGEERGLMDACSGDEMCARLRAPTRDSADLLELSDDRPKEVLVSPEVIRRGGRVPPVSASKISATPRTHSFGGLEIFCSPVRSLRGGSRVPLRWSWSRRHVPLALSLIREESSSGPVSRAREP